MKPPALVLDLDHTLVGDVTPLLRRYALLRAIRGWGLACPCPAAALSECLSATPLLRPGVADFLRRAASAGSKLFVFTASEREWATALVRAIGRAAGVRFARPLFARDSCHVRPDGTIGKSLSVLGPRRASPSTRGSSLGGGAGGAKVVVIDNATVWSDLGDAHFLHCPTYRYAPPVDVLEGIPTATLRDPRVADVVARMARAGQCYNPVAYADAAKAACHRHRFLARSALQRVHQNAPHLDDDFFTRAVLTLAGL